MTKIPVIIADLSTPDHDHIELRWDWTTLWSLFCEEPLETSLRAFARRHEIPWSTLQREARDGDWLGWREKFHADREKFQAMRRSRAC